MLTKGAHLLVTGGAGFMGSAFIRHILQIPEFTGTITNIDLLTYAGNINNLQLVEGNPRYHFYHGDIGDESFLETIYEKKRFDTIVHFAAETHVDRSIHDPQIFAKTNVLGTVNLLNFIRKHPEIHFHHVSTDEVYGALEQEGIFTEDSPYLPTSPYAASKAASDHFVLSYAKTYGISCTLSHASNNYGPCQFPEKFVPLIILRALREKPLPIYGTGENIRDWLFVEDHADAVWCILQRGKRGEVYNIGGACEKRNIDLLLFILQILAQKLNKDPSSYNRLITFVEDRPGHDFRYALDKSKMKAKIGWGPRYDLHAGMRKTVQWYLEQENSFIGI